MKARSALMRAAVVTGTGALVATARRRVRRAASRRKRNDVLKKVGVAAAVAGAAVGTIAAIRAARNH